MKISIQIPDIVRQLALILLITNIASSAVLCAPSATSAAKEQIMQPQSTTTTASTITIQSPSPASAQRPTLNGLGSNSQTAASEYRRDGATSSVAAVQADATHSFDGKDPFSDDSLWQIPIHLTRDADSAGAPARSSPSSANADRLDRSASEMSSADEHDDSAMVDDNNEDTTSLLGHQGGAPSSAVPSSSAPTIISASTDLKTAAGYHHAIPHHHEPASHYGGGHHADASHNHHDHYGKYFQYASVPYPYSWDFGYRRGNPYHTIERYEHGKGPHFQTKVKWSDKYGGHGVHVWDYNHDDHSHHYTAHDHGNYESHGPSAHYGAAHQGSHYPVHH